MLRSASHGFRRQQFSFWILVVCRRVGGGASFSRRNPPKASSMMGCAIAAPILHHVCCPKPRPAYSNAGMRHIMRGAKMVNIELGSNR